MLRVRVPARHKQSGWAQRCTETQESPYNAATPSRKERWTNLARATIQPRHHFPKCDANGFAEVVERSRPRLIRFAWRITRSLDEAEDVVQESVLKAFANLHRFRGHSRVETWLHRIVRNTAYNRIRSRGSRVFVSVEQPSESDLDVTAHQIPDPASNPEQWCEFKELETMVLSAVERLSPRQKAVIKMCVLGESSYIEAASVLNLNLATVKARIFQGRGQLLQAMRRTTSERKASNSEGHVSRRRR